MSELLHCDLAIIGAGAGGLSVAAVAAQLGLKVVLVEQAQMGGDCLNVGCVPSKSLIAAAKAAQVCRTAGRFGIDVAPPRVDFQKVMAYVQSVITKIAPHDSIERFKRLGVHVLTGHAQFIDADTLMVNEHRVKARQFVIASGSTPAIPPIPGLDTIDYLTNETIFSLQEKPTHLIIIGGGAIGCELAQAFSELEIPVSMIEALTILPRDDRAIVAKVRTMLENVGVVLYEHAQVSAVSHRADGICVTLNQEGLAKDLHGSHLLIATGRRPNVRDLGLDKAGVNYDGKGIQVNTALRTTNRRIYAIGDVIGALQFTHVANYHAGLLIRRLLFKLPVTVDYRAIPHVTYVTPELAQVGLNSEDALRQCSDARTLSFNLIDNDRARTEDEVGGIIQVTVSPKGFVLGASILAPQAGELILPWVMLMQDRQPLRRLSRYVFPYPTYNEMSKAILAAFYEPKLYGRWTKQLVRLLGYLS